MESLLNMVESLPIWIKISIPFIGSIIYYLAYDLIKYGLVHVAIVDDIKSAIKTVVFNIPAYISIIIILGIAQLVLNFWDIQIWSFITKHIWLLFYIFLVFIHVYVTITPEKSRGVFHRYKSSNPTISKYASNKPLSETKQSVKTVVVPISKSQIDGRTDSPLAPSNMTTIENKLRDGINVKLDFNKTYNKIDKSLKIIKNSGAKITFCNMNPKQRATLDNMRSIAAQIPGLIIYDVAIEAGFEAEELAASGACFTCDCSNRSTCIPNIAKAAKEGKGHVIFINCKGLGSFQLKQLRELGGTHVNFNN